MSDTADGLKAMGVDPKRLFDIPGRDAAEQAAFDRINVAAAALIEADVDFPLLPGVPDNPLELAEILEGMARSRRLIP